MRIIGVDVGGTFTDIIYCDMAFGEIAIHKVSTTPDDPSRAIIEGITEICSQNNVDLGSIDFVLHGSTTATNAVFENRVLEQVWLQIRAFVILFISQGINELSTTRSCKNCLGKIVLWFSDVIEK